MKCLSALLAACFILAISPVASALDSPPGQTTAGSIKGVITDSQGAVVPGANIQALNNQTSQRLDTKSNEEGAFEFAGVPFGDYAITITAQGFAPYKMQVALDKNSSSAPHDAAVQLNIGELSINVQLADVGSTVTMCIVCNYTYFSIKYSELPLLVRRPERLVALQAGVAEHKGNFSIAGRRVENKTALFDGLDNRDPATGRFVVSPGLDSLSEFNSDYTNTDTDLGSGYGQSSAPQLAAVTMSGTNTYHAQGFWNLERTGMSANNFFTNRGGLPRDQISYDQAGIALGGNISLPGIFSGKDHAFFFISYERDRDRRATGRQIAAPLASFIDRTSNIQGPLFRELFAQVRLPVSSGGAGGLQDIDNDGLADIADAAVRSQSSAADNLGFARVDFMLSNELQLNLRYDKDRSHLVNDFNESSFTPASPLDWSRKGQLFGLNLTAAINPSIVNDFKIGYRNGRTILTGAGSDATELIALNSPIGAGGGLPELPEDREDHALLFADTFLRATGSHSISAGAQVTRRSDTYANSGLSRGRIYYADALALVTDGRLSVTDQSHSIIRAELAPSPERERYRLTDLYAFASDRWIANPRFILNYAAGYNIYSGAVYGQKTDRNNFAPSLSFAYSPTESESIILRGGASIIYAPPSLLPYGEVIATPFYPIASGFASLAELTGPGWAASSGTIEIEREFSGRLRTSYTESAFLAVQHSFGNRLILEASYNSTLGRRLLSVYNNERAARDKAPFVSEPKSEEKILIASDANSNYHALQLKLTSRERRGITFQAHYTFSKAIDTASDDRPSLFRSLALGPVSENSVGLERSVSDFDRRHKAVGYFLWRGAPLNDLPASRRWILGNWQLSGIVTIQSGPRVSLYSSGDFFGGRGDFNRDGVLNDRLAYLGAGSVDHAVRQGANAADGYFDPSLFGAPGKSGHLALGRNVLPAPGYGSIDLSARKRFLLSEDHFLDLRVDVFNALNRANFLPPVTDSASADFGRSIEAGAGRILRLMLKYSF